VWGSPSNTERLAQPSKRTQRTFPRRNTIVQTIAKVTRTHPIVGSQPRNLSPFLHKREESLIHVTRTSTDLRFPTLRVTPEQADRI